MEQTYKTEQDLVKALQKILDQISGEIKEMTWEEECAYREKLIAEKEKVKSLKKSTAKKVSG